MYFPQNYITTFFWFVLYIIIVYVSFPPLIILASRLWRFYSSALLLMTIKVTCPLQVMVFVLWCVSVGILTSILWQWLPWYLWDLADNMAETQVSGLRPCVGQSVG